MSLSELLVEISCWHNVIISLYMYICSTVIESLETDRQTMVYSWACTMMLLCKLLVNAGSAHRPMPPLLLSNELTPMLLYVASKLWKCSSALWMVTNIFVDHIGLASLAQLSTQCHTCGCKGPYVTVHE